MKKYVISFAATAVVMALAIAPSPGQGRQDAQTAQERDRPAAPPHAPDATRPRTAGRPEHRTLRGTVVWANEVVRNKSAVSLDEDAPNLVALEAEDDHVYLIMKEGRGRAFYQDERLRGRPMQLVVKHWEGLPFVQVVNVYSIKQGKLYAVDYWCDVCAIAAYDVRLCDCCQNLYGPMRLREQPLR